MFRRTARWRHLQDDAEGQGMVEYALIIAFVAVVSLLVLGALGGAVSGLLDAVADVLG